MIVKLRLPRAHGMASSVEMIERQKTLWLTPEAERSTLAAQCLKRMLVPDDVARLVLWLAADDSRMCTGQNWVVDGGWW